MAKCDVASIIPLLFWIVFVALGAVTHLAGEKRVADRAYPVRETAGEANAAIR
jgi:hypothetical protein